jgi:hypothetical protein
MFEKFILAVQNTQEMDEDRFPDAELELVHKIHNEHEVQAKAELRQFARKYILKRKIIV